jgi:hypothetical protein
MHTSPYEQCSPRDVQGFFAVFSKKDGADDLCWLQRLVEMMD